MAPGGAAADRFCVSDGKVCRRNLLFLNKTDDEFLCVFGIGVDNHLAFAGEPTQGCKSFFFFKFSHFFELLQTQGLSRVEGLPDCAGVGADFFYIHSEII